MNMKTHHEEAISASQHRPVKRTAKTPKPYVPTVETWKLRGPYTGEELKPFDGRPGAMDAYALPSRGNAT